MAKNALAWVKETYDAVGNRYGLKEEQYKNGGEHGGNGKEEVPTCKVHGVPMIKQEGKYGPFWSCHQRNADGSFLVVEV